MERLPPIGPWRHAKVPNPWSGLVVCPSCRSDEWTLPWQPGEAIWRCCACRVNLVRVGGKWIEFAPPDAGPERTDVREGYGDVRACG